MVETEDQLPDRILELVERFENNLEAYKSPAYKEAQLRQEFLNPFYKALGWDVANERGYAEAYKDVVYEEALGWGGPPKLRITVSVSVECASSFWRQKSRLLTSGSFGSIGDSGNILHREQISSSIRSRPTGYITGVSDAFRLLSSLDANEAKRIANDYANHTRPMHNTQVKAIVDKYMKDSPQKWNLAMAELIYAALVEIRH